MGGDETRIVTEFLYSLSGPRLQHSLMFFEDIMFFFEHIAFKNTEFVETFFFTM